MTWPDTWADEFQPTAPDGAPVMAPPISLAPSATTAQGSVQTLDAPPVSAPLAPPHTASAHSTVLAPPPPRDGDHHGELRISLRIVREAVLALVATAVMSSAAIAARPIDQLLRGAEYSAAIAAQLVFALVIIGLAAFALNNVKSLFDFYDLARRQAPAAPSADATADPRPNLTAAQRCRGEQSFVSRA